MEVYLVVQNGFYRHDVFGILSDKQKAIDLADDLARTDGDGYHTYQVIPFQLDEEVPRKWVSWRGGFHGAAENEPVHTVSKEEPAQSG